ncbi:MAG: lipopolysaccharide assembly protein LapA domain-containing protein [Pseudomarimonas sp.]
MRIAYLIVCLMVMASGAIFGALNPQPVFVDFYVAGLEMRLGIGLLLSGLAGAALGGSCMWIGVVLPLRRQLARQRRDTNASEQRILASTKLATTNLTSTSDELTL